MSKKVIYLLIAVFTLPILLSVIYFLLAGGIAIKSFINTDVVTITIVVVVCLTFVLSAAFGNHRYGWFEIVNPFNVSFLKSIYNSISTENRTTFWNISVSFVVAVLTAWLGFSVSKSIQTNNEQLNNMVLRYQVIDRFGTMYEKYNYYMKPIFWDFKDIYPDLGSASNSESIETTNKFRKYINQPGKQEEILNIADSTLIMTSQLLPYLSTEKRLKMESNNGLIALACYTARNLESKASAEIFKDSLKAYLRKPEIDKLIGLNTNMNEAINLIAEVRQEMRNSGITNSSYMLFSTIIIPSMIDNEFIFSDILYSEDTSNPILGNIYILICAFLIGYMIFRVLILKVFDGKIDQRSSKEFEQLKRTIKELENDNRLLKLENAQMRKDV